MGFRGIGSADLFLMDGCVPLSEVIVPKGGSASCPRRSPSSAWATRGFRWSWVRPHSTAPRATFVSGTSSAAGSPSCRCSSRGSPTWSSKVDAARLLGGQVLRERDGQAGVRPRDPAARWLLVLRGVRGRAAPPGCARLGSRRGNADDAANQDRLWVPRPPLRPARLILPTGRKTPPPLRRVNGRDSFLHVILTAFCVPLLSGLVPRIPMADVRSAVGPVHRPARAPSWHTSTGADGTRRQDGRTHGDGGFGRPSS